MAAVGGASVARTEEVRNSYKFLVEETWKEETTWETWR
jgi:hypothetical protein